MESHVGAKPEQAADLMIPSILLTVNVFKNWHYPVSIIHIISLFAV